MLARIRKTTPPLNLDALFARNRALYGNARMEGEGGTGGAAAGAGAGDGAAGAGTGGAGGGDAAAAATAAAAAGAGAPADWDGKVESLPADVQKMIRDLRKEAGDNRTGKTAAEQRQQDMVRAFAKAAGIDIPGDEPDPGKLAEQLTTTQTEARQAAVELAVFKAASKHQGDPNALLDSRGFLAKLADLDPKAADFATQVDTAIADAVKENPKLKTVQAAGASGAEFTGGSGEGGARPKSIKEALAR